MTNRIQQLQKHLTEKASAILVTDPYNILYLTGFIGLSPEEREAVFLVTQKDAFLFIPRMYEEQVIKKMEQITGHPELVSVSRIESRTTSSKEREMLNQVQHDTIIKIVTVHERHELLTRFADHLSPSHTLLFEAHNLRVSEFNEIKKLHSKLQGTDGLIESMRQIKDSEEIKKIKKAVEITDKTYEKLIQYLSHTDYTQLTELDIADKIVKISRTLGGEGLGFESIVAAGTGSSLPHYHTSNRKLQSSNLLLIDMGIKYQGYTGDLTRCVYLGKATAEVKKTYELVYNANRAAIDMCKAGITCEALYAVAHDYFAAHKLENYFIHGLGHGVGLEIHEYPHLRNGINQKLQANMAITIEPGLYFPNNYGIRIEDFVIVKENGCEVLSKPAPATFLEI